MRLFQDINKIIKHKTNILAKYVKQLGRVIVFLCVLHNNYMTYA